MKPKSKTRHDIAGVGATPHYSTTSDDIWMKNWGEYVYYILHTAVMYCTFFVDRRQNDT